MNGMKSCDSPPPSEYQSSHEARTKYQGIRAHHFHTMINGNVSNVKNSHRPTKTVVGILGFVTISLIILVAVLVTHYEDGSKSHSSSVASQAASAPVALSKPTTSASPSSVIRSPFPSKTTSPSRTQATIISTVTTPEVETVTSLAASGFVTFISTCLWGCPGYACANVNDCRDPYCCINGTCDSQQATCGPAADCSLIYSGVC